MKGLSIGDKVKIVKITSHEDRRVQTIKGKVIAIFDEFILVKHKNFLESYLKKNFWVEKRHMKLLIERDKKWIEVDKTLFKYKKFNSIE